MEVTDAVYLMQTHRPNIFPHWNTIHNFGSLLQINHIDIGFGASGKPSLSSGEVLVPSIH